MGERLGGRGTRSDMASVLRFVGLGFLCAGQSACCNVTVETSLLQRRPRLSKAELLDKGLEMEDQGTFKRG